MIVKRDGVNCFALQRLDFSEYINIQPFLIEGRKNHWFGQINPCVYFKVMYLSAVLRNQGRRFFCPQRDDALALALMAAYRREPHMIQPDSRQILTMFLQRSKKSRPSNGESLTVVAKIVRT